MSSELSVADAMALTKSGSSSADGFGGTWTWVFFLFFLLAWGGGGLFGGSTNNATTQGAITREALYEANNSQDTFRNFGELNANLNSFQREAATNWGNIRYDDLKNYSDLQSKIAENRYAADSCCCNTNRNIDAVKYELTGTMNNMFYEVSKANCDNTQKILDMLTSDKIDQLRNELTDAKNQITTLTQANSIVSQVRPFPSPAYVVSSPYGTSSCGATAYTSYGY